MSKHSKNNTSSSVFTYQERRKLKNVYGTIQTRIGQDSVKKFQYCTICHNKFIQPTSCDHGHMFCRSCVIQYLVQQKKKMQSEVLLIEKQKKQQQLQKKQKQLQKQVEKLQKFQKLDNFLTITQRKNLVINQKQPQQNKDKFIVDLKNSIKPTGIYQQSQQRQKYIKSSFWAIENTPQVSDKIQQKQKAQKIIQCPGNGIKHKLTLKKLRDIKVNQIDNVFCCWVCRKQIGRQKIGCYKCGHLVCLNCKSLKCQICDTVEKWMEIEGNSSAFSSHNKSQVKTYTHAFLS